MEIERKFLISKLPDLSDCPYHEIQQAYLCTGPVVRIRRQDNAYYLTYKGGGLLAREEYNLPLTPQAYAHLLPKADGNIITKRRYLISLPDPSANIPGYVFSGPLTVELDIFSGTFAGLQLAEVEFASIEDAKAFVPPDWFGKDVTMDPAYHNSTMSQAPDLNQKPD